MAQPPATGLTRLRHLAAMPRSVLSWLPVLVLVLYGLAGCVQLPRTTLPDTPRWSGRLAVQIEGQADQSFSAGFDLQGSPRQGELTLYTPLGGVLARLRWQPGDALLESGNQAHSAASLDELLRQATGTPIPVAALFDWLAGRQAAADGWQVDLGALDQGRLVAQRHVPGPRATLRIALER